MIKRLRFKRHCVLGDCQAEPGVPLNHLSWINEYTKTLGLDVFINIGDFGDFPSLSFWDKGTVNIEGKRVKDDIDATLYALKLLHEGSPLAKDMVITLGNHEERIVRVMERHPQLHGVISLEDLKYKEYYNEIVEFGDQAMKDGIAYSHFFQDNNRSTPVSGMMSTKLRKIGYSFVAGHSPGLELHSEVLGNGSTRCGVINGACYLHHFNYKRNRGNQIHFRGIVVLNEVKEGSFQPMPVSLEYLCRKYEGMTLYEFSQTSSLWNVWGKPNPNSMRWVKQGRMDYGRS